MKKLMYLFIPILFLIFTACEKNGIDNEEIKKQDVIVYLPDDLEEFDLQYENQTKKLDFEWESEDGFNYAIAFSLDEEMNEVKTVDVGSVNSKSLTHLELDNLLDELGVKTYHRGEIFWQILGKKAKIEAVSEVRSIKLFRFFKPFIDPRDQEEYRVARVIDPLTGEYAIWLGDNLRAVIYSDGTPVNEVKFYEPKEGEDESWTKKFGAYYTWNAVMKGNQGAEEGEKIQGIAPVGWHIPTKVEWDFLINCCDQGNGPATELKDKNLWNASATNVGTNSINFNMAGAGYIWTLTEHSVIEEFMTSYFWTATAPRAGDIFPWDPPAENFPNQAVTYGFNANDFGAALYPYDRTRGFSLRCVMD
ncbi:MAG: fibrobacter succinogenes major paralogous domain-containing protein [Pigmentiphaga sp.]|nr:fibrobacter succinogenes major paralogous domain-containing protein [Pigmentiphaga sp.]